MIKGRRDAPMARKRLSSHTVFPNRVPLERARTQLPLVGYSAPSFPRIIDSSEMNQTNKLASPTRPAMVLWQSDLKHLCSLVPLLIPCEFLPLWFRTIGNASLLRLIRKHDVSGETNTRSRPLEGPAIADRAETHPTVGHKHVKKRNEQAGVRKQSQPSDVRITLMIVSWAHPVQ